MISDYADMLVTAGEYSGRNDIAHLFPRFTGLAETKLNRRLRVGSMEKTETITVVSGEAALPSDYIEARSVTGASGCALRSVSLQVLQSANAAHAGVPAAFSVVGNVIHVRPVWDGDLELAYYAKIPGLSPTTPTNWLLQTAPDAYLYALVEEIAIWGKDVEGAGAAASLKEQALRDISSNDERARFGQNIVRIAGPTP